MLLTLRFRLLLRVILKKVRLKLFQFRLRSCWKWVILPVLWRPLTRNLTLRLFRRKLPVLLLWQLKFMIPRTFLVLLMILIMVQWVVLTFVCFFILSGHKLSPWRVILILIEVPWGWRRSVTFLVVVKRSGPVSRWVG